MSTDKLTGQDLLVKLKELGNASKGEQVRACGYVSLKKDGTERLNYTAFYAAVLDAKGVQLGGDDAVRDGRRNLPFKATVGKESGNLVIGHRYVQMMGLDKSDQVAIRVRGRRITLEPLSDSDGSQEESQGQECALAAAA
jgi:hypothetical protein